MLKIRDFRQCGISLIIPFTTLMLTLPPLVAGQTAIEEIVVTAEKRERNLQEAPVAVTAFTQNHLDQGNIINLVDLSDRVPGLNISKNEGSKQVVTLRGIGYEANENGQSVQGVALHTDGIFLPRVASLNASMLDVERIEVLRGPQGTVFGQNSTGGTINIISKRPELGEFSGNVSMTVGNYYLIRPRAVVNLPLGDTVAIRLAGEYYEHDGFSEIVNTPIAGFELDEKEDLSGRIQILWRPLDNFSVIGRAQFYHFDGHESGQRNVLDPSSDKRDVTYDVPSFDNREQELYSAELEWELPWFTVKSFTGYQETKEKSSRDNDRGTAAFITSFPQSVIDLNLVDSEIFTQEINVVSRNEGRLEWLAGLFYMDEDTLGVFEEYQDFNFDGQFARTDADLTISPFGPFQIPGLPDEVNFQSSAPLERNSFSVYGQATYNIADKWRLIGGFRYTDEDAEALVTTFFGALGPGNLFVKKTKEVTWKAGLQYDFTDDIMGYFTVSTGIKPGGVNLTSALPVPTLVQNDFETEEVLAYEVGLKSRFADGRIQANVAAFYYDYEQFQFHTENFAPFQGGVGNVPEIEIYGAELEFNSIVTDSLRMDFNLSWLEGEVTKSHLALSPLAANQANGQTFAAGSFLFSPLNFALRGAAVTDLIGNTPAKMPSLSFNASLNYDFDFTGIGLLTSKVHYTYRGSYDYWIFNDPGVGTPEYDLINLYFQFKPHKYQNWTADFMITNLENDNAVNARWTNVFGIGATAEQYVSPRQFLFRLGYEF